MPVHFEAAARLVIRGLSVGTTNVQVQRAMCAVSGNHSTIYGARRWMLSSLGTNTVASRATEHERVALIDKYLGSLQGIQGGASRRGGQTNITRLTILYDVSFMCAVNQYLGM